MRTKKTAQSLGRTLKELETLRTRLDAESGGAKVALLASAAAVATSQPSELQRLHAVARFLLAFPDNSKVREAAAFALASIVSRIAALGKMRRAELEDSGICGTSLVYEYSFDMAMSLFRRFPSDLELEWNRVEHGERLDSLFAQFVHHAEQQIWDDGDVSTRDWVQQAKHDGSMTDFAWLARQMQRPASKSGLLAMLYDEAEVPLRWTLRRPEGSKTFNEVSFLVRRAKRKEWRKPPRRASSEIRRPMSGIKRLEQAQAAEIINAARLELALRHREVYAMTYANADEVYLAPLGLGTHVAVLGVRPDKRFSLEGNYGYMIFANGVPVGYGGASPLFGQVNTGASMFDEFRGSESRFLFLQTLRVFRSLFGCDRFIVNSYQYGAGNSEAVATGAFWFYYKIGFRPTDADLRRLAASEFRSSGRARSAVRKRAALKKLAAGDLYLTVQKSSRSVRVHESWLGALAMTATARLARCQVADRQSAAKKVAREVALDLGARHWHRWPANEKSALLHLAPIVGSIPDIRQWSRTDKRKCIDVIRAKGRQQEREFVRSLAAHTKLRDSLIAIAKKSGR